MPPRICPLPRSISSSVNAPAATASSSVRIRPQHLVGLAGLAAGVDAELAGVGVAAGERVHRVGQAALLADALEQPRAHPAAERGATARRARTGAGRAATGPCMPEHDVGLLGVVADAPTTGRAGAAGARPTRAAAAAARAVEPAGERRAHAAARRRAWSTLPATDTTIAPGW